MLKAKVFISCGQRKETDEVEVAHAIANVLDSLGFEPYVASEVQDLRGLRENLFSQLATSEYFLFIDFKREQFANCAEHRGSLFSNQELAIASYLELPVIGFQQKGVELLGGMLAVMQANFDSFEFADRLPEMVRQKIKEKGWRTDWKNALSIIREPRESDDAEIGGDPQLRARFFHVVVKNLNPYRIATNCTAYPESIIMLPAGHRVPTRTVELKWAGYTFPYVNILNGSERQLDACFVLHSEPHVLHFSSFADSGYFMRPVVGHGEFEITFLVVSENFPPARLKTRAIVGQSIEDASLT